MTQTGSQCGFVRLPRRRGRAIAAARATQMLRRLDAPVLGVCVIGAVSSRRGYGYGYGYG